MTDETSGGADNRSSGYNRNGGFPQRLVQ